MAEKAQLESRRTNLSRLVDDLKSQLKECDIHGECGITISAHASVQICKRLELLAMESSAIYRDVLDIDNPTASLLWPTNAESFVISLLSKARLEGKFKSVDSKSGGVEYHYEIELNDWSTESKKLIFTGVVENNNVKTGYFNWV